MAFKGMDPEEGREVASEITRTGEQILEYFDSVTSVVSSVDWIGPDYDAYLDDWNSFVSGSIAGLVEALNAKSEELTRHADQQDDTSNAV
ncbi:hypothetical protein M4D54_12120 [Brachybacterium sp. p3-SID1565]|nr:MULTISPECIES: hypothetical protein [Brachybacterium]MCT1386353.1 hypothetical protein [Brachybacterium sp. p3-SID1565]MCT1775211.1 hypothetical protein [Brachybacterium sp. p3-SID957]